MFEGITIDSRTVGSTIYGITYTKNTGKRQLEKNWSVSGSAGMELMPMLYIAVVREGTVVGHVPRRISRVCSLFIRRGGVIRCCVTDRRRYSSDLPQEGLEIPCLLSFELPTYTSQPNVKFIVT